MKTEMEYHQNRSRNWERYMELLNHLFSKYGQTALSESEWILVCENLVLYNNTIVDLNNTVKKYISFAENSESLQYKYYLVNAWINAQEKKPFDDLIEKAKQTAAKEKVNSIQFERLKKQYFPE